MDRSPKIDTYLSCSNIFAAHIVTLKVDKMTKRLDHFNNVIKIAKNKHSEPVKFQNLTMKRTRTRMMMAMMRIVMKKKKRIKMEINEWEVQESREKVLMDR